VSPDLVIELLDAPVAGAIDDVVVEGVLLVLEDVEPADAGFLPFAFFFLAVCLVDGLAIESFDMVVVVVVVAGGVVVAGAAAGAGVDGAVDGAVPCANAVAVNAAATRAIRSLLMESSVVFVGIDTKTSCRRL
jgi:hypothetical protein